MFKPQLIVSEVLEPAESAIFLKSNTTLITGTLQNQDVIIMRPDSLVYTSIFNVIL